MIGVQRVGCETWRKWRSRTVTVGVVGARLSVRLSVGSGWGDLGVTVARCCMEGAGRVGQVDVVAWVVPQSVRVGGRARG